MATIKKMMKKSAPKKAQTGKTVMQKLKMKYPDADTSAAGDTRFQEFNAYSPKKELKRIADTDKAFDTKYGKGKPAVDKTSKKKYKMGGKVKKAQVGKKLPLGASSASAEKDYAKSDSLRNVANKMSGMDYLKNAKAKKPNPRQQSDSLRMEADKKTKATGGVPRGNRFKMGGKMTKAKSGTKISKKK